MSTKCLICYCDTPQYGSGGVKIEEINIAENSSSKKSILSKHLSVIFILRNIFEVPVSQLAGYLKNCPKVDDWICICDKCQEIVKGYRSIYEDLLEISRKFEEAKLGIVRIVKTSYKDDGQEQDMVVPLDISDECRRFINNYEYKNLNNPFKDGDLKVLKLVKSIHHDNWHWTRDPGDTIGLVPDSPADVEDNDEDHWSGGELAEPESEEQLENVKLTRRGRGRPPKSQKRLKELMDDWKPGHKAKKCKPKTTDRWSGDNHDAEPVKPEPEEQLTSRGRGRPPGKHKRLKESMEDWKPYYKPKKWKPKTKRKPTQRQLKYPCPHSPECSLQFSSKTVLDTHLKTDHGRRTGSGRQKTYPLECYQKDHNGRLRLKIPSKCESCNKWFKSQGSLRTHIKFSHENRFPFYCKTCGIGRTTKSLLEKHEALCSSKPDEITTLPETESCPEEGCTMVVSRVTGLEIHLREKHPEREPFSWCPHCEQKLYTKMGHVRHLKSEHKISKPFKCEHCGYEFKTQTILDNHKKSALRCKLLYQSETEATIICDICGGKYSSPANLQKHVEAQHEDKFKLRCEHCGKGFDKEEILNVHLFKRHQIGDASNLKYKCKVEGCSRICFTRKQFESHTAMHEGKAPQFTCEECGKGFHGRCGLTQHRKLMHVNKFNTEKFKCEVCGAEFGIIEYLKRHKRTVHKIFPEKRRQDL